MGTYQARKFFQLKIIVPDNVPDADAKQQKTEVIHNSVGNGLECRQIKIKKKKKRMGHHDDDPDQQIDDSASVIF
jgi:hypothetical protein